jgi:predicted NUDIX family NTP pyrophosphohydrolase
MQAAVKSAGVLLYKREGGVLQVLLVHPGGPFWAKKDAGAWSIPKGEYTEGEDAKAVARREFEEELGQALTANLEALGEAVQPSRKRVIAFTAEGDFDVANLRSNSFEIEWPPRSGRHQSFPEVDRAEWFPLDEACARILPGQRVFLDRLAERLGLGG